LGLAGATLLLIGLVGASSAAYEGREPAGVPDTKEGRGVFALEGEFVHNKGELQINITNWGLLGSRPSLQAPYSDAPSAMWPAGSGVDYLWAAGLWVGAIKAGVPLVSTGQFTPEFLANPDDPLDTVYETFQGATGGARYPDPEEDDDQDGQANEDPLNALDDDRDGLIDEDFAAIGNQHFRAVMKDNTALAEELFPDHDPLDLLVIQESFQWEADSVDDFVGFQFEVTNIGVTSLNQVFLGFFADCDIGPRSGSGIADDDLPWFFEGSVKAADNSLVPISVAAMYDADGDAGQSPGFFGIMFVNHDTDPSGQSAPQSVGITSFQSFSGNQPFDRGGDPTNDAERYELLSRFEKDSVPPLYEEGKANDFRILLATGPFAKLDPGESLTFQSVMVVGEGPEGLKRNAAEAALTYYGAYFNRDTDPGTGTKGRETQICIQDFGPPGPTNDIFTIFQDCVDSADLLGDNPPSPIQETDLDEFGCVFINGDCDFEEARGKGKGLQNVCRQEGGIPIEELGGCTGVEGKEFHVPWLVGLAPNPPNMRLWQTNNRVHVFWNNFSQIVPDVRLQEVDFEAYLLWRADGWDRPFGSSVDNGPESRLWRLIAQFDIVNFFEDRRPLPGGQEVVQELPLGANTGLDVIDYVPAVLREGSPESVEFAPLSDLLDEILADPKYSFLNAATDPGKFVRYTDERGQVTPIGQDYPQLADWQCCLDQQDTLYYDKTGVEWFEYVDLDVHNGIFYFYSVTASDFAADATGEELLAIGPGLVGDPQSNFEFATPVNAAQTAEQRGQLGHDIYVVPNPATRESLEEFSALNPNAEDPTGVRVMFSNLPQARNTINIYTLAGDLVQTIDHDGTGGEGSAFWNLVSRNGQEIVSGIYMYSVESDDAAFERVVGRFVVIR
jgi:hypothetical protein